MSLQETLERRDRVQTRIVQSLAHLDREKAMHFIPAWISLSDLEDLAPTLSGDPEIIISLRGEQT